MPRATNRLPRATRPTVPPPLEAFRAFPLPIRPKHDWHEHPRHFGATRPSGRKHAACDLYADAGTQVLAVADGVVIGFARFKVVDSHPDLVYAIEIEHQGGWIARYCEVAPELEDGVSVGKSVRAGQAIGRVGRLKHVLSVPSDMLHFELYGGWETGPLTQRNGSEFHRRGDLLDPTHYLDACAPKA